MTEMEEIRAELVAIRKLLEEIKASQQALPVPNVPIIHPSGTYIVVPRLDLERELGTITRHFKDRDTDTLLIAPATKVGGGF